MSDLTRELVDLARAHADAPAVPVVDRLLALALERGASDLHVDPDDSSYVFRMRMDGVLHEVARLERAQAPTLVARMKVLAQLPTYVTDVAQDGRIPAERVGAHTDLRLATLPTVQGERAVVRLFGRGDGLLEIDQLGLPSAAGDALRQAVHAREGMVVVAGPAGSGKSTTIHAGLREIIGHFGSQRSIVGIEDPVERVLSGVTQTEIKPSAGFGFAEALQAVLRQDPEVIYLGEVRDPATATTAIEAAFTGHLVITTLHSGSCAQVFTRLLDMGIEPHLLTSALAAVFSQRLLRRLCPDCAAPLETRGAPRARDLPGDATPLRPVGCPPCLGTGYRGRLPIVEHVTPRGPVKEAVLARGSQDQITALMRDAGVQSLEACALDRVAEGRTSLAEVRRVLGPKRT